MDFGRIEQKSSKKIKAPMVGVETMLFTKRWRSPIEYTEKRSKENIRTEQRRASADQRVDKVEKY